MSSSRIVSVFGATGLQGSAVVEALLKDGTFTPRAISRNPESDASLKLKARGVEVVKGDSGDKPSLVDALRGSEAVFAVTVPAFTDSTGATPDELTQGTNMVDAAKEVGVKFFIFSSLPSITKLSGGKYQNVVHYEDKAAVEEYLKSSGLPNASLLLGGFLEGYWRSHLLHKTATGFDFGVPSFTATDREAFTWVERDVPAAALALLKNYTDQSKNISGKSYPVVTTLSYTELVAKTAKVLGAEVTFTTKPDFGLLPVDEMFAAHAEYSGLYTAEPEPNPALVALGVNLGTIDEFLQTEVKPRFGQ
ncbi:hypothetical protein B0H17DRAFT_1326445 [Mycena rosella]|uniref:NmrA-like domain-containing protein n=1 Tax=Mycena rosella TaxID=1033263 RepID=A0AAD7M808_MYCRO|nr:hypothetical protein B0H17DRAFT_1326445 [Mycena rosella]